MGADVESNRLTGTSAPYCAAHAIVLLDPSLRRGIVLESSFGCASRAGASARQWRTLSSGADSRRGVGSCGCSTICTRVTSMDWHSTRRRPCRGCTDLQHRSERARLHGPNPRCTGSCGRDLEGGLERCAAAAQYAVDPANGRVLHLLLRYDVSRWKVRAESKPMQCDATGAEVVSRARRIQITRRP